MKTAALFIGVLYALLHIALGAAQLRRRQIPPRNAALFITGGLVALISPFLHASPVQAAILLGLGMLLIQLAAILNGRHLNGSVTMLHQAIRGFLLVILVVLVVI